MRYIHNGYNYVLTFQRGEQLTQTLTDFVKEKNIKASWISGLGGAQWAELGFYDFDKQEYIWKRFDTPLEITALQGNVAWMNGEPALHIHGTFAGSDYQAIGGHVKELEVSVTCELHLHTVFDHQLNRSYDTITGANLLDLPSQP